MRNTKSAWLLVLTLCVLTSATVFAQGQFPINRIAFRGTLQSVSANGVALRTSEGTAWVPTNVGRFEVHGQNFYGGQLTQFPLGIPVAVTLPPLTASVVGVQGNIVTMQSQYGTISVPTYALDRTSRYNTYVYVRRYDGQVVRTTLGNALNLQAYHGGTILGTNWQTGYNYHRHDNGRHRGHDRDHDHDGE